MFCSDKIKSNGRYKPPDGGYGWVICISAFWLNFLVDGTANCFAVHLQEYREYFNASVGSMTFANSLLCGTYALSGQLNRTFLSLAKRILFVS